MLEHIDKAHQQDHASNTPRDYLGASSIGWSCSRKIQYSYHHTIPDKPIEARTLRIFERGHIFEEYVAKLLKLAGFEVVTVDSIGEQHGFREVTKYGTFSGHIDGILTSGPVDLVYPALWENKTVGAKSYRQLSTKPLAEANNTYATQIAVYQQKLELTNPAIFTVLNADTMELYMQEIPYDSRLATSAHYRAESILRCANNELMPRVSRDPKYFECNWCEYRERCWNE